ncbi:MAG: hypothetical protein NT126_13080 [Bacteroidetes bacterium]|nr:hypothetical protein [Bacteroidota bacterium]
MKPILYFFVLFLILNLNVQAADNYPVGARSAGVANASVTFSDVWSSFHNQAGLAFVKETSAGVYFENSFLLPELSIKSFALAVPSKAGTFSLSGTVFGGSLYNEKKAGLAYSKKLGGKFSGGVQLDYLSTFIAENYGTRNAFAVEIGILGEPLKNLKIGAHIFNPSKAKLAEYGDERIPVIMRAGASYSFSEKVTVSAEEEKDMDHEPAFKAGIEYHPADVLYLRCGIASNPSLSTFGFGLKINRNFLFDMAASWHQQLGFSPGISLDYQFN